MSAPGYFPLPVTVEDVTAGWLTAAFRQRTPEATVLAAEVVDVLNTTTTKIRMRLTMNDAGKQAGIPELVIVKGGFQEHSRELDHMHRREVQGYRDVFPHVPIPHPACFFADFDVGRRQGIIIMEDLAARGVTFCHAAQPQTFEQVSRRLAVLAAFMQRHGRARILMPEADGANCRNSSR